jgi:hypothetical protein
MLRKNKGKLNGWISYIKIRATNSGRTAEESGIAATGTILISTNYTMLLLRVRIT